MILNTFQYLLALILTGYLILGKNFAYVGYNSFYIGELALFVGLFSFFFSVKYRDLFSSKHIKILVCFMIWGAICTIPYIKKYGLDALRDGAIWGYGTFSIIIFNLLLKKQNYLSVLRWYKQNAILFLFITPILLLILYFFKEYVQPLKIASNFYLFNYNLKGGDIAVHLSGILSFLILLSDYFKMRNLLFYLLIICWFTLFLFVAFVGRAAFLTIVITWIFLSFFSKPHKYFIWLLVFLIVVFVFIVFDIAIETGSEREISLQQLYLNIKSIFYRIDEFSGEGSKLWRLLWWKEIINYTFFGDYFWFGKGYGINLADDDGFQVDINHSLRSPHNGHLTFLARSGVPGFTLWLIFLFFLFKDLFKTFLKLKSANLFFDANIYLFVFCYLFSFVINGAFDVFLEGPQGGIWFWSIVGFAISIIHLENAINR